MFTVYGLTNAAILIFSFLTIALTAEGQVSASPGKNPQAAPVEKLNWLTPEEAYALSKNEPRKFFFDLYTNWCGWCKKMDATTFSNPVIAEYLSKKYYAVKFNAEMPDTVHFNNNAYPFVSAGMRGYNEFAYELSDGKLTYPTIVFLDEQAKVIQAIPGYRDAEELDKILKYFGENHYRTTDWQTFSNNYKSPFAQ